LGERENVGRESEAHPALVNNPGKHGHVAKVADCPYSSFHRYVEGGILLVPKLQLGNQIFLQSSALL
jgi:hypothetical protein